MVIGVEHILHGIQIVTGGMSADFGGIPCMDGESADGGVDSIPVLISGAGEPDAVPVISDDQGLEGVLSNGKCFEGWR